MKRPAVVEAMAVGGGGGGGGAKGGGGGGGSVVTVSGAMYMGGVYSVMVGAGGAGGSALEGQVNGDGRNGSPSSITLGSTEMLSAIGGGGGGAGSRDGLVGSSGGGGGGGGNAGGTSSIKGGHGGEGIDGLGYKGGNGGNAGGTGYSKYSGGGGGGAGGAGSSSPSSTVAGLGGVGLVKNITGSDVTYGSGGTGGAYGVSGAQGVAGTDARGNGGNGGSGEDTKGYASGGRGGSGIVVMRFSWALTRPESQEFVYDMTEHDAAGEYVNVCDITGPCSAINAGVYTNVYVPKTGYTWDDGTVIPYEVVWSITRAPNEIRDLKMDGWRHGCEASVPSCTSDWGTVTYEYSVNSEMYGEYTTVAPTSAQPAGKYWVRAAVLDGDPNYCDTDWSYVLYSVVDEGSTPLSPAVLGRFAPISFSNYTGAAVADFPVLVKISPNMPAGFDYSTAKMDGSDIRFCDVNGNYLPHEIDEWNSKNISYAWVLVPELTSATMIYMCWGPVDGQEIPENDPTAVWKDYACVVHCNTERKDSSPNRLAVSCAVSDLVVTGVRDGATGSAFQKDSHATQGVLIPNPTRSDRLTNARQYSITAWYKHADTETSVMASSGGVADKGFTFLKQTSSISLKLNDSNYGNGSGKMLSDWEYAGFSYDAADGYIRLFHQGSCIYETPSIALNDPNLNYWAIGNYSTATASGMRGGMDEIRIYDGIIPADYLAADYQQMNSAMSAATSDTTGGLGSWGAATNDSSTTLINWWIVEPSVSPTFYEVDSGVTPVITDGIPSMGKCSHVIVNAATGEIVPSIPEGADGDFDVVFTVPAGSDYAELSTTISIRVVGKSPYTNIGGNLGDSGRVLLMNRDRKADCPIDYQCYGDTKTTTVTWWEKVNTDAVVDVDAYNLAAGTEFKLHLTGADGDVLWYLQECRHGNTYPANNSAALATGQNYLPYESTSYSYKNRIASVTRNAAGQCVMRNSTSAQVVSSCFTNGIGTIYFDAVNAWAGPGHARLVVEVATNCVNNRYLPPTDANSLELTPIYGEVTNIVGDVTNISVQVIAVETNLYGNANWQPYAMIPLMKDGTPNFVRQSATTELDLAIENGGTANNFYRVYVPVTYRGPARFRIRRTDSDSTYSNLDNVHTLILLDNIICSYPAMRADLEPYGIYDVEKKGKQVMGLQATWETPFPAADESDVYGRGKVLYSTNEGNPDANVSNFVSSAKMHYRWRYLNQVINSWKFVNLDVEHGFRAHTPLELPGIQGDIEFYYDLLLNAPYYSYVDYSGVNNGMTNLNGSVIECYSERISSVTNQLNASEPLPSSGKDWFVRLREGESDYEGAVLVAKVGETVSRINMEVVGNHAWRGYLETKMGASGGVSYRFELLNRQEAGATEYAFNTNFYYTKSATATLPVSDTLLEGDTNCWSSVPLDGVTGYLMFQIDDSTKAITVVHADYQDFNEWSDAASSPYFVGNSIADDSKSGTSPNKREYTENFKRWLDMPATNGYWVVPDFADINSLLGRESYKTFSSDTDNNWEIGQGMWVCRKYMNNTRNSGVAIQMEGQGKGFVQFTDRDECPRGLENISFNARLGQFINFDNFSFYDDCIKSAMTNYTFVTMAAFDLNKNQDFSGNASLSMAAYYRQGKGCYEARLEYIGTELWDYKANKAVACKGMRLCLYRWNGKSSKLLSAWTNNTFGAVQATGANSALMPFYITCSNDLATASTWVTIGVKGEAMTIGAMNPTTLGQRTGSNKGWFGIAYRDSSANRHTCGTYGVLATNSRGFFGCPEYFSAAIPYSKAALNNKSYPNANTPVIYTDVALSFPGADARRFCYLDLNDPHEPWVHYDGRMTYEHNESDVYLSGIKGDPDDQTLIVSTASAGKTDWKELQRITFSSFGSSGSSVGVMLPLYTTRDCSVRIAVDGTIEDERTDIVIDSIKLRQWRGDDYANGEEMVELIDPPSGWHDPTDYRGMTNFIFTSGWIKNESILMSAKRTASGSPCSIRSPLMDGAYGRGKGLGMFSFSFTNAQSNVRLKLQVATNVTYVTAASIDILDDELWTDVTNYTFTTGECGMRTTYIGMHGVQGAMRLLVDPDLVNAVSNEVDTSRFGEIFITDVMCRDEPSLDSGCWWGWNLKAFGTEDGSNENLMMYLYDLGEEPPGMSMVLNNSVENPEAEIDPRDAETYKQNKPFVQTPTFVSNVVGEVTFRARKYDTSNTQPAAVTLYGSYTGADEDTWTYLTAFTVSNETYSLYSYKTEPGQSFKAFRLGVDGVQGVRKNPGAVKPDGYTYPVRVAIDEVLVSEAVRARVAFRNVGAFRGKTGNEMSGTTMVPGVPSEEEQPLCNESWGVQCEVYAAMLPDEIDFETMPPQVKLHWFTGAYPWGFENWRTNKLAKSAYLARATDTNLVYRSSYVTAPDAVIPMSQTPGTIVQYSLEVIYCQKGSSVRMTNYLDRVDWVKPEWYDPVDLNRDYGNGIFFAAYNILDTVAPHWAWINEVNIFGGFDANWSNLDKKYQFIEIAVPAEADISGWKVNVLAAHDTSNQIITNTLGTFGSPRLSGTKEGNIGEADNMVFRVLASQATKDAGNVSYADGTLDAVWTIDTTTAEFTSSGEISYLYPVGFQLVRGSGILEHEIVTMGTNMWNDPLISETLRRSHSPSNTVDFLNDRMEGSHFIYVGDDDGGEETSRGVFEERGKVIENWNNTMLRTPGRENTGQSIDPDHPMPNGSSIMVYSYVDTTLGHILQTFGDSVWTNGMVQAVLTKGSFKGTNITYRVDPWYEMGTVTATVNKQSSAVEVRKIGDHLYEVTVGKGCSNNVTVNASAQLSSSLVDLGIVDANRYKPAVVEWLSGGETLRGPFAHPDSENVYLADFIDENDVVITNLTLTQMYWFDMDPTVGNLALKAYMAKSPTEKIVTRSSGVKATNLVMGVYMAITNRASGEAWTPYVLRGLDPATTSWDYVDPDCNWSWTSVTFKITGRIANGKTGEEVLSDWLPVRWFVFKSDSFLPLDSAVDPGITMIEVDDPHTEASPGYWSGWSKWPDSDVLFRWAIDGRLKPYTIEPLNYTNYYNTVTP